MISEELREGLGIRKPEGQHEERGIAVFADDGRNIVCQHGEPVLMFFAKQVEVSKGEFGNALGERAQAVMQTCAQLKRQLACMRIARYRGHTAS